MPKIARIVLPGLPHHITQRGNRRCRVFADVDDREVFLRMLLDASQVYSLKHSSYCLMSNHIHLISTPTYELSLAHTMRDVLGKYAVYFNSKHALTGHLWQGRYYSNPLDAPHFWAALRYVERNPVRAGLVRTAEEYPWSSAAAHCGLKEDPLLEPISLPEFIQSWSLWLREEESEEFLKEVRRCASTGRPCGSKEFVKALEERLGITLLPRRGGRPRRKAATADPALPLVADTR